MIVKTIVQTKCWDLYQVQEGFLIYNEQYRKIRPDQTKCKLCHKEFMDGDIINLAAVRKHVNIIICDKCVDKVRNTDVLMYKGKYAKQQSEEK